MAIRTKRASTKLNTGLAQRYKKRNTFVMGLGAPQTGLTSTSSAQASRPVFHKKTQHFRDGLCCSSDWARTSDPLINPVGTGL